MGPFRRTSALAATLLLLALPAAAPAQTPGDEQYTDPFGGGQEEGQGNDDRQEPEPEPEETPVPSQPSAPESTTTAPEPAAATEAQAPSGQEELPRTGADAGLLALGGTLLLAGGIALRVRVSEPAPRRR